jgi:enamine deaminase RidA (YjgF/YER057c/UK114 family)
MTESNAGRRSVKRYLKREAAQARGYSQAVITEGGKTIWLAGQVGAADAAGRSLAGDFDGQVRRYFPGSARPSRRPAGHWPIW